PTVRSAEPDRLFTRSSRARPRDDFNIFVPQNSASPAMRTRRGPLRGRVISTSGVKRRSRFPRTGVPRSALRIRRFTEEIAAVTGRPTRALRMAYKLQFGGA